MIYLRYPVRLKVYSRKFLTRNGFKVQLPKPQSIKLWFNQDSIDEKYPLNSCWQCCSNGQLIAVHGLTTHFWLGHKRLVRHNLRSSWSFCNCVYLQEMLERALGGLRHKMQAASSNPAQAEKYRRQQRLLERELSRVRSILAHNSKVS